MNAALILLSAVLTVHAAVLTADQQWEAFKSAHGRKFSNIEARKAKFLAAKAAVDKHNVEADQGLHTYWQQVNDFAIMTEEEKKMRLGMIPRPSPSDTQTHVMTRVTPPASMDLRTCKCMPAMQNQAACGSCSYFSAVNPIEFQYCCLKGLTTPTLFSQQQLVDCTAANGNLGCNGGWMDWSWTYLKTNNLMKLSDYPYTSGSTGVAGTCKYDASKGATKVASYTIIPAGSGVVAAIKQALTTYGPVSVTLDASSNWSAYTTGIFSGACTTNLNHAVNIVGYGTQSGTDYWIVRNQWGTGYGDQGYWLMKQGVNQCGIEDHAMYPVVAA